MPWSLCSDTKKMDKYYAKYSKNAKYADCIEAEYFTFIVYAKNKLTDGFNKSTIS